MEIKYWVLAGVIAFMSPVVVLIVSQWAIGLSKSMNALTGAIVDLRVALQELKTWSVETFVECEDCETRHLELKEYVAANLPHRGR